MLLLIWINLLQTAVSAYAGRSKRKEESGGRGFVDINAERDDLWPSSASNLNLF